jgi:hypothetical protein
MSASMNAIISQYLQFVMEQQRGIDRLGDNIINLNTRVGDVISLYAHSTNLRNVRIPNPLSRRATPRTIRTQPPRPPTSPLRASIPSITRSIAAATASIAYITPPIATTAPTTAPTSTTSTQTTASIAPTAPIVAPTRTLRSDNLEQLDEFAVPPQGSRTLPRTPRSNTTERTNVVEEPTWNTIDRRSSSMPINSVSWNTSSFIYRPPTPAPVEIPGGFQPTVDELNNETPAINTRHGPINSVNSTNIRRRNIFHNSNRIFRFSEPDNTISNLLNNSLLESPVRIVASHSQIMRSTELLMWQDISDNYQTTCPIDLNLFVDTDSILRIKQCSHIFREVNLRRHFRNSSSCPICRYDIRDYIENSEIPIVAFTSNIETSTG